MLTISPTFYTGWWDPPRLVLLRATVTASVCPTFTSRTPLDRSPSPPSKSPTPSHISPFYAIPTFSVRPYTGWNAWVAAVEQHRRYLAMATRTIARMKHQRLFGAWAAWDEFTLERQRQRALLRRVLSRAVNRELAPAWRSQCPPSLIISYPHRPPSPPSLSP